MSLTVTNVRMNAHMNLLKRSVPSTRVGFTLIELVIVVIIVGILAMIAIPQYTHAVERSKAAKARSTVKLIFKAEQMRFADIGTYSLRGYEDEAGLVAELRDYIELDGILRDPDWEYRALIGTSGFYVTARRTGGPCGGSNRGNLGTLIQWQSDIIGGPYRWTYGEVWPPTNCM